MALMVHMWCYRPLKWFKSRFIFVKSSILEQVSNQGRILEFLKMKLFIIAIACIGLIAASNFGLTGKQFAGDDESYLMITRRHYYHVFMNQLARSQKMLVTQKQSNKAAARLRAKLSMILANGEFMFDMANERPKSRKANNRRNRFRNYHN